MCHIEIGRNGLSFSNISQSWEKLREKKWISGHIVILVISFFSIPSGDKFRFDQWRR